MLGGFERAHVQRAHDTRNERGESEQDLALLLKLLQEGLPLLGRERPRNFQALERDGGLETFVMRAIHDAEPTLGNDALHAEHGRLKRADDPEDVLCHPFRLAGGPPTNNQRECGETPRKTAGNSAMRGAATNQGQSSR
jgi:hypothetical protein